MGKAITYPNATHYSEHFSRVEMNCHCKCRPSSVVQGRLAKHALIMEAVRKAAGGHPLSVHCSHRCQAQNTEVGSTAKASEHINGNATDCHSTVISNAQLRDIAKKVPGVTCVIIYDWGVHIDSAIGPHRPYYADFRTKK